MISKQFILGALPTLLNKGFLVMAGFFMTAAITKSFLPDTTGAIFFYIGVLNMSSGLARLGMESAIIKDYSRSNDKTNMVMLSLGICVVTTALAGTALYFLKAGSWQGKSMSNMAIMAGVYLICCNVLLGKMLSARSMVATDVLLSQALPNIIFGILVIALAQSASSGLEVGNIMSLYLIAVAVPVAIGLAANRMFLLKCAVNTQRIRKFFATAGKVLLVNWMVTAQAWMSTILLGILAPSSEVAAFAVSQKIAQTLSVINMATMAYSTPKLAKASANSDPHSAGMVLRQAIRLNVILAAPLLVALIFSVDQILLYFGPQYMSSSSMVWILIIGQTSALLCGPVGPLLIMSDNEKVLIRITAATMLMFITLVFVFVPKIGAQGMCIATAVWSATFSILAYIFARKTCNVSSISTKELI